MGLLGHFTSGNAPFLFAGALCLPAGIALAMIRTRDIDYATARSAADCENPRKGTSAERSGQELSASRLRLLSRPVPVCQCIPDAARRCAPGI
jgi:hypothetical protein